MKCIVIINKMIFFCFSISSVSIKINFNGLIVSDMEVLYVYKMVILFKCYFFLFNYVY